MKHVDEDDDAFDERGILRDGKTFRLPMRMADSLQRQVRDFATEKLSAYHGPLHRPGFVRDYRDTAGRQKVHDAYRDYEMRLVNAYKTPAAAEVSASPDNADPRRVASKDGTRDCYSEYDARVSNLWRGGGAP